MLNISKTITLNIMWCSTTRLSLPIKGFLESVSKICLVPGVLYGSVVVGWGHEKNQTEASWDPVGMSTTRSCFKPTRKMA